MAIKLVCCDIDGTLTDGTMFVSTAGELFKQFSHRDGRAFHLLREKTGGKVHVAYITNEIGGINKARTRKLLTLQTVHEFIEGVEDKQKSVIALCIKYGIMREEVLFIGDDTNDLDAMEYCGFRACPSDALPEVKKLSKMMVSSAPGGRGAVRQIIDALLEAGSFDGQEKKDTDYYNP